jgi:hypothetical protein
LAGKWEGAMSVFLAATLTTFAIFCLLAFSHPGWAGGRAAAIVNWGVPRWLANTLVIIIGVAAIVGLLFATFRFLHPWGRTFDLFDAFTGRNAASLLFGAITGVLLGAFISRVFFRRPGRPIEGRDKIIAALLVLFFVLGIGGEEAIRGLAQRVSKVSVLGTEIDFSEPAKSSRANLRGGAPNTAVPLPSSSISSASSYGLTFLSNLSVLIERDRKYLIIAAKLRGGDAKILENKIKEIDETLKQPSEFAKIIVEPFAVCLEELQTQTGDTAFVNDRLLGLVDELRILIAPDRDDDDMPSRLTKSFFKQSDELARFAMRIAVGPDVSKDPATRGPRAKAIAESCNRLYFLLFDAECWHGQKSEAACWEEKKSALLNSSSLAGDWVWTHSEEIRAFYQKPNNRTPTGEDSALLSTPQGPSAANYITNVISEVSKSDSYRSRPYISMVYAGVMAQVGRSEAALVELDHWLQRAKPDVRLSWYAVRALSTLSILTEEWLRRPSTYVPTVLLEYYIKNNQEAAGLLESILHIDKFRDKYAKLPDSLEKTGFRSRPQDHKKCQPLPEEAHDFDMLQLAFTARVTTDLIIAHHALSHPRYPSLYSHEVAGIVEGVLQTDLSCTVVSDEPARIDQWRAESLRLYALTKLRNAGAIAELRGKESADDSIKMGLDAAALGSEIIYPHARKDQASSINQCFRSFAKRQTNFVR